MQWEAPSKPLAVDDPLILPEREVHAEIGINWFLDQGGMFWGERCGSMEKFIGIGAVAVVEKDGQVEVLGAGRGKKTKSSARLKLMEKKSSESAARKHMPKQGRRWIR